MTTMDSRRFELRWRHHQSTVVAAVAALYRDVTLVDVTLACEDQETFQAHKLVLSACSHYFQSLFTRFHTHQHPIIVLKDVTGAECRALLDFMYFGEVAVAHDQFERIIRVANSLQVRGLAEMETTSSRPSSPGADQMPPSTSPPPSPSTKCNSPMNEPPHSPLTPASQPPNPHPPPQHSHNPSPHPPSIPSPPQQSVLGRYASLAALAGTPHPPPHSTHPQPPPHPHFNPYTPPLPPHHPGGIPSSTSSSRTSSAFHEHLATSGLFSPAFEERKRGLPHDLDEQKRPHGLPSPYMPQLQVKRDLGGTNNWDGGGSSAPPSDLDSPLGGADSSHAPPHPQRHPYLPHPLFSIMGGGPVDPHTSPDSPLFVNWNGMIKGLPPRTLPPPIASDKRTFSIVDPLLRGSETRLHKCQYCSRKFKRKDHLKTHIRIHTGERPYKCKICNRGFIQSQQVKIHMKVHVREDVSGLGGTGGLCPPGGLGSLGRGGSSGGPPLHSMPPIFPQYSDHKNRSSSLHSSDSHGDLDPHLSNSNIDSDNDCKSEPADGDSESRHDLNSLSSSSDRASVRHLSSSSSVSGSISSSSAPSSSSINNSSATRNNNSSSVNNNSSTTNSTTSSNSTTGSYVSGTLAAGNTKMAKISSPSPESPAVVPISGSGLSNSSSSQSHPSNQTGCSSATERSTALKDTAYHIGAANLKK